jgi:hypothetical protein
VEPALQKSRGLRRPLDDLHPPIAVPAGALSALCDFTLEPAGSDPSFDAFLDGLRLVGPEPLPIFADGFESGDTTAWSSTVP